MNKEQLEKDIAEMKARLASMEAELAKPVKSKVFAPEYGQDYWYIGSDGSYYATRWDNDKVDNLRLACGNVYETRESAEKARGKQLATVRVLNKLRDLEGDWVADWNDSTQRKHTTCFSRKEKVFNIAFFRGDQYAPKEWYSTEAAWEWVIDNMDADLRLMFEVE